MATVLAATAVALSVTGCLSMPSGGPVLSYPVTQGPGAQSQRYVQMIPRPPGAGWTPTQIVRGFLTASASFANRQQAAREYLTPDASRRWRPSWSATVFSGSGPIVSGPAYPDARNQDQVLVTVSGSVQAKLSVSGTYAVPSAPAPADGSPVTAFTLVKSPHGEWRISSTPPSELLLTSVEFNADYQLRNLYFLDPSQRFLVPDPVYVPLQTTPTDLMNGLVRDLINPPKDWLADGTRTAFPPGTKLLSDVTAEGGVAMVNLGGAMAKVNVPVREEVSSQLLSTLSGAGQGQPLVRSVSLSLNGKPWNPSTTNNPVQSSGAFTAPTGQSDAFYYLDGRGEVRRQPSGAGAAVTAQDIGTGYSAIAVSPDGHYLAALRNGTLYTGPLSGPLVKREGSGYTTMSWDVNDNLWTTANGSVYMMSGDVSPSSAQSPQAAPASVNVVRLNGTLESGPVSAVRVAPDGVRVALIIGGESQTLAFGAIATPSQEETRANRPPTVMQITLSPFSVASGPLSSFSSVAWYGPDNVITLGATAGMPGPVLTEQPVNGGSSTTITSAAGIESIAVSADSELIAGAKGGVLLADASPSGAWARIGTGLAPAYPG